jgi:hypothetical protein
VAGGAGADAAGGCSSCVWTRACGAIGEGTSGALAAGAGVSGSALF